MSGLSLLTSVYTMHTMSTVCVIGPGAEAEIFPGLGTQINPHFFPTIVLEFIFYQTIINSFSYGYHNSKIKILILITINTLILAEAEPSLAGALCTGSLFFTK